MPFLEDLSMLDDSSYSIPIVVAIVEGSSDKRYLNRPLQAWFEQTYGGCCRLITIEDMTGDQFIDDDQLIPYLQERIKEQLSSKAHNIDADVAVMIIEIIHIFDIDEAFIDENHILEDSQAKNFIYSHEGIRHVSKNPVIERNKRKQKRIKILLSTKELTIFERNIPYSVYYYSINIDDYYFENALNITPEEKNRKAAMFERDYFKKTYPNGVLKLFIETFKKNNPSDYPNKYNETWSYICADNNSLKRCSNAFLIVKDRRQ